MSNPAKQLLPPDPKDFGLDTAHAPSEGTETIKLAGLTVPKSLSPTLNWILGLSVAVPLAVWSLWGIVSRVDSLVLGIAVGLLAGIIVFQLAVSVVPLSIDVFLYGVAMLIDEVAALFSKQAQARIAYRKAWRAYREELARGGYGNDP